MKFYGDINVKSGPTDSAQLFQSSDDYVYIEFEDNNTDQTFRPELGAIGNTLYFKSGGDDTTDVVILSNGNVGIGASAVDPAYRLEVFGDIRFAGTNLTDMEAVDSTQNKITPFRTGFQPTNRPPVANYFSGFNFTHNVASDYETQIAFNTDSTPSAHIKHKVAGTWGEWYSFLLADNNGLISINGIASFSSDTATTTTTSAYVVGTFALASFRSGKFVIQAYDSVSGEVQISELLVVHDGTNAYATEYGNIFTGSAELATYDVDISGADVRILANSASTNSTTYKLQETLMVA